MVIVFCIEPVGTFTACTTNVMPNRAMIAVTTSDSKYSRHTLRGGPGCAGFAAFASAPRVASSVFERAAFGVHLCGFDGRTSAGHCVVLEDDADVERATMRRPFRVHHLIRRR